MKPGVLHFQTDCLWQVSVRCVQVTAKAGSKLVHVSVIQFLHWTGHFLNNDVLQKTDIYCTRNWLIALKHNTKLQAHN